MRVLFRFVHPEVARAVSLLINQNSRLPYLIGTIEGDGFLMEIDADEIEDVAKVIKDMGFTTAWEEYLDPEGLQELENHIASFAIGFGEPDTIMGRVEYTGILNPTQLVFFRKILDKLQKPDYDEGAIGRQLTDIRDIMYSLEIK